MLLHVSDDQMIYFLVAHPGFLALWREAAEEAMAKCVRNLPTDKGNEELLDDRLAQLGPLMLRPNMLRIVILRIEAHSQAKWT
jgi:hypothetical protein